MIKAFVLDWGDTLHFINQDKLISYIEEKYGVDAEEYARIEHSCRLLLDAGELSKEGFFKCVEQKTGLDIDWEEYYDYFFKECITPNERLISFLREVKDDHRMIVHSNNNPLFVDGLKPDIEDIFDRFIISYEEKLTKPDKEFYRLILEGGLEPDQCVYIDNKEEFAKVAEEMGMKAVFYSSFEDFKEEIESLGIEVKSD